MKICGKDYRISYRKGERGAGFSQLDRRMWIGTEGGLFEIANCIIHEAVEAILLEDVKRLTPHNTHISNICDDNTRYIFHFDHDYLCQFTYKLQDALLTSGFFKLTDPRKKKGK
jgi:hypothetical protein